MKRYNDHIFPFIQVATPFTDFNFLQEKEGMKFLNFIGKPKLCVSFYVYVIQKSGRDSGKNQLHLRVCVMSQ
jgi:hypothetical protein